MGTVKYTVEYDYCMVFVQFSTNAVNFGEIIISVNTTYVYRYQNPGNTQGIVGGFGFFCKKGDIVEVKGSGLKTADIYLKY